MGKWQKALENWPQWNQSVDKIKADIKSRYGNLDELLEEFNNEPKEPGVPFEVNEAEKRIWDIVGEIQKEASRFVTKTIGVVSGFQSYLFETFWLTSAFPSLEFWFQLNTTPAEELQLEMTTPWYSPEVRIRNGEKIIIDRICWHRKMVEPADIIRLIPEIWREDDTEILRRAGGGPIPKDKEYTEYPEGIVCCILKYKCRLSEQQIAEIFGWKVYEDKDKYLRPACTTYRERLRQVKGMIDMSIIKAPN